MRKTLWMAIALCSLATCVLATACMPESNYELAVARATATPETQASEAAVDDPTLAQAPLAPRARPSKVRTGSTNTDDTNTDDTNTDSTNADSTDEPSAANELAPAGTSVYWRGQIDGSIGYTMWLAQTGNYLVGEITYESTGVPIRLAGRGYASAPGSYRLNEYSPAGDVTGTIHLDNVSDGVIGAARWEDRIMLIESTGETGSFVFEPNLRTGTYRWAFAPFGDISDECCGPAGALTIIDATADTMTVSINATTSGPAFNVADVPEIELPLDGNRATFEDADGNFIDCKYDITVFDGVAFVDYLDDRFDCGWGHNASVVGIYVLVDLA